MGLKLANGEPASWAVEVVLNMATGRMHIGFDDDDMSRFEAMWLLQRAHTTLVMQPPNPVKAPPQKVDAPAGETKADGSS